MYRGGNQVNEPTHMQIEWRHLDLGETCGRCSDTGANLWAVITELGRITCSTMWNWNLKIPSSLWNGWTNRTSC